MKEIKLNSEQLQELLDGKKQSFFKARSNCKLMRTYFDYVDFASNVGGGIPVFYDVESPYGKKGDIVKVKGQEFYFSIERVRFCEDKMQWNLSLVLLPFFNSLA